MKTAIRSHYYSVLKIFMIKVCFYGLLLCLLTPCYLQAQLVSIQWQKCFGGSYTDHLSDVKQTPDGGNIAVGATVSSNGDITFNRGSWDAVVVKRSSTGSIQWKQTYGGTAEDIFQEVDNTPDGGYIIVGYSLSNNVDVSNNYGLADIWVVKLNSSGTIEWQKTYGGSNDEYGLSIKNVRGGGYLVAGYTSSNDRDITLNHGQGDYWVLRIGSTGELQWQKTYGGTANDGAFTGFQSMALDTTFDRGSIIIGSSNSTNGDVTGNHGMSDFWVVKIDSSGSIQWQKTYGGSSSEEAYYIKQTKDSGYILCGSSKSFNGDISNVHGSEDLWALKIDRTGNIVWQKAFGGKGFDYGCTINPTADSGFIVGGYSNSTDGDVTGNNGDYDYWILKLNSFGKLEWEKSLGGTQRDGAYNVSVVQTLDGGFITTGTVSSNDGDVSGKYPNAYEDAWTVKLVVIPPVTLTWTGLLDNSWNNFLNWMPFQLPNSNTNVIIKGGLARYPELNSGSTINSMVVEQGGSITIKPGGRLTVIK